jgi:membrane fusion protein, multidrug efflux system
MVILAFDVCSMKLYLIVALLILTACSNSKTEEEDTSKISFQKEGNNVEVIVLKQQVFKKEIVSNGRLKALKKSDLRFSVSGRLDNLTIKNGQYVQQGQVLGRLEDDEFKRALQKTKTALTIAGLELEDFLVSRDLSLKDSAKIPGEVLNIAKVRSGYTTARQELAAAEFNFQNTLLKAPFSGKVANIKANTYEQVNASDIFCTLIDDAEFEVEFFLVENEIRDVKVNDRVRIVPFSLTSSFDGVISQINPLVDEHGLIMVKARTKNSTGSLLEGMNVRVYIEKDLDNLLVVPKSAIVQRQNQEVLFKYSKRTALWTYVKTNLENSTSYSVVAHPDKGATLEAGDTVIISGNLNLAHESEVSIK